MKQHLNPDQTAKLIELGFEKPSNMVYTQVAKRKIGFGIIEWEDSGEEGSYSIGELISFCPTTINVGDDEFAAFEVYWDSIGWRADYHIFGHMYHLAMATELIDCLFELVVKLKEEGVI